MLTDVRYGVRIQSCKASFKDDLRVESFILVQLLSLG
jgi:hypothetical protein